MPIEKPIDYYEDEDKWGGYQNFRLFDIISRLELESQQSDSYLKGTNRSYIIACVKNVLQTMSIQNRTDIRRYSVTVPDSLYIPMPQDYIDYSGIFVVVDDIVSGGKRLQPLDINRNINIAIDFLQSDNGDILFDEDGYILQSDGLNAYAKPYVKYSYVNCGRQFTLDTSKLSEWGEFNEDKVGGKFAFSSDLADKEIVIVYVSDGLANQMLNDQEITIPKQMFECLYDGSYYTIIQGRRTVPANEKYRAKQQFKASRHKMNIAMSDIDLKEISRIMRQKTMIL